MLHDITICFNIQFHDGDDDDDDDGGNENDGVYELHPSTIVAIVIMINNALLYVTMLMLPIHFDQR